MPLTSFESVPQPVVSEAPLGFRLGTPDVEEAAGVANQTMRELGLAGPDKDKNLEELKADFTALTQTGYDGRLLALPRDTVPFSHIVQVAEGKRPEGVAPVYFYEPLWQPGKEKHSYKEDELNNGPASHVARLAVFNSKDTGYDPILHSLNVPFDNYKDRKMDVNPDGVPNQLDELADDERVVSARHQGFTLEAVDHRAFAVMAVMDRIRGVKPQDQILSQGFMRVPQLGRRAVDGVSFVGNVSSCVGQLNFGGSSGYAYPYDGVGRSLGLTEA